MDESRLIALHSLIARLEGAETPTTRREYVRDMAGRLGISERQVYRDLADVGFGSGRQARADKGQSGITVAMLMPVAIAGGAARNKRGQPNLPITEVVRIAAEQGWEVGEYSYQHIARRLREEALSMAHLRAGEAAQVRRSKHPNQVWFFDISVAINWYFRDENGKYLDQYDDAGARFYEGKIENYKAVRKVIRRYCVTDHLTGAYYVQYFYAGGENAIDVVDFFYRAMSPKPGLELAFPFRGRPTILVMDQGSANKSALTRNLLRELNIGTQYHQTGNAKASGSVESRHNGWQRSFEGRLRLSPVQTLEELNTLALKTCVDFQSARPHSRHGKTPLVAWRSILPEQLREAPPRDVFFQLAHLSVREATLTNQLILRADNKRWQVTGFGVHPGQKVDFRLQPIDDHGPGIRVWDKLGRELAATAVTVDAWGQMDAKGHTFGDADDTGSAHARTPAQQVVAALDAKEIDIRVPVFAGLDDRIARQTFLPIEGTAWAANEDSVVAVAPKLSAVDVRIEISLRLDRPMTPEEGDWWQDRCAHGVTSDELEALYTTFLRGDDAVVALRSTS